MQRMYERSYMALRMLEMCSNNPTLSPNPCDSFRLSICLGAHRKALGKGGVPLLQHPRHLIRSGHYLKARSRSPLFFFLVFFCGLHPQLKLSCWLSDCFHTTLRLTENCFRGSFLRRLCEISGCIRRLLKVSPQTCSDVRKKQYAVTLKLQAL